MKTAIEHKIAAILLESGRATVGDGSSWGEDATAIVTRCDSGWALRYVSYMNTRLSDTTKVFELGSDAIWTGATKLAKKMREFGNFRLQNKGIVDEMQQGKASAV